ncbi:hypothetical protein ACMGT0_20225 [Pseudomonas sp. RHF3.3-3]|uniref:hypothetical protein n=1 Tax=Pseudomonas TaxID=286 RepID=UPI0006B574C3|nr:hypothetical protein [Pseudomonas fuscovaginae]
MSFLVMFLGFLLFLPYYASGIEARFDVDKKFKPYDLMGNLRARKKGGTVLPVFGLLLIVASLVLYFVLPIGPPVSLRDRVKDLACLLLFFLIFFYGYMQELYLEKFDKGMGKVKFSELFEVIPFSEKVSCFVRAARSYSVVLIFFGVVVFIKRILP